MVKLAPLLVPAEGATPALQEELRNPAFALGRLIGVLDQGKAQLLNIEGDGFTIVADDERN
jgi:hypothetical protein